MSRKSLLFLNLFLSLLILAFGLRAIARAQETTSNEADDPAGTLGAVGTAFTYQGQLKDANGPVSGNCDFQLRLWDALTGGSQAGSTLNQTGVAVSEGLFTVQLDFGAGAFDGSARWLEIAVRCPAGGGAYNTLSPRQPLTSAPYALYSLSSANADTLDGNHAAAFQQHYQNLVVVAKSGGDFTTITEALNSITTNRADNPFTIYVAPGVYTETISMKPYVDIEGAGEQATKITYTGNGSYDTGTVVGADNAELRFLSVENTGGNTYAFAIYNNAAPRLTHVTATASEGTYSCGVYNYSSTPAMTHVTATASGGTGTNNYSVYNNASSPAMTNVSATASEGTNNFGVFNANASSPMMTNVTATASGGSNDYGVWNNYSSPTMKNVTATASGGTGNYGVYNNTSSPTMVSVTTAASGGTYNYGVYNNYSSPVMTSVTTTASGGTNSYGIYNNASSPVLTIIKATASGGSNNYGVWNESSSPTIQNSVISASGGTNDGLHNVAASGSYIIKINNSQITGNTSTIYQDSHYTTQVGASQLTGAGAFGGIYVCVASYNGNYTALDSTCH